MTLLRVLGRSPHLLEVVLSYGSFVLLMGFMCFKYYGLSASEVVGLVALGTVLYTFLEYWFHRVILHRWLEGAHGNHHRRPRNLRIITTPMIPAHVYGVVIMVVAVMLLGRKAAYGINCGIALGQIIMDAAHVLFHSRFRPWYLESARSYHLYHHFSDDDLGHGLTTSFWDMVFCTLPRSWSYYKRMPCLRYLHLPFPLLSFIIIGLLCNDESKSMSSRSTSTSTDYDEGSLKSHGSVRAHWIAYAWLFPLFAFFLVELAPTRASI